MNAISFIRSICFLVIVLFIYQELLYGQEIDKSNSFDSSTEYLLPESAILGNLNLIISPNHKYICFSRKRFIDEEPELFLGAGKYVMVNIEDGHALKIKDLLSDKMISGLGSSTGELAFSPSGNHVLIHATLNPTLTDTCDVSAIFLYDLNKKMVDDIDKSNFSYGHWIGKKVAVSSAGTQGINRIKIVDIDSLKKKNLNIRGFVIANSFSGNLFAIQADPSNPERPVKWKEMSAKWHTLVVNLEGKIIKDIGPIGDAAISKAIMSPNGKFLMYKIDKGRSSSIYIFSIFGSDSRIIEQYAEPIYITNEGIAITKEFETDKQVDTNQNNLRLNSKLRMVVKALNLNGKQQRLFVDKDIIDVTVAGDRIYYVTLSNNRRGKISSENLRELLGLYGSKTHPQLRGHIGHIGDGYDFMLFSLK